MKNLTVTSELSEINKIRTFLKSALLGLHLSDEDYYMVELSLVEICINIIRYAYPIEKGDILLKTWEKEGKLFLEIRDNGIPFDPKKSKKPDINELIQTEKKGGLGIFLTRKFMDGFKYKREKDQNILTLYKKID